MKGLPWFYLPERVPAGTRVPLDPDDARHATGPLRLRAGVELTVGDGAGWVAPARLVESARGSAMVDVGTGGSSPRRPRGSASRWRPRPEIAPGGRCRSSPRSAPTASTWSGPSAPAAGRVTRNTWPVARRRWRARRRSSRGAPSSRRSGSGRACFAGREEGEDSIVLYERAERPFSACLPEDPAIVGLHVGPEGGLGERDLAEAAAASAVLVSLGAPNLRTETAAVVVAALALNRYGRLG